MGEGHGTRMRIPGLPRKDFHKILELKNEIEASLLDAILNDEDIPHLVVSYHDPVYSGIFLPVRGWGHVEAPEAYRDDVIRVYEDILASRTENDELSDEDGDGEPPFND